MGRLLTPEELIVKYPEFANLEPEEQAKTWAFMQTFREAAASEIKGADELLKLCDGCAFKHGTEANNSPYAILDSIKCVMEGVPFYCHKRFNQHGQEKICNGWINVMNSKED